MKTITFYSDNQGRPCAPAKAEIRFTAELRHPKTANELIYGVTELIVTEIYAGRFRLPMSAPMQFRNKADARGYAVRTLQQLAAASQTLDSLTV